MTQLQTHLPFRLNFFHVYLVVEIKHFACKRLFTFLCLIRKFPCILKSPQKQNVLFYIPLRNIKLILKYRQGTETWCHTRIDSFEFLWPKSQCRCSRKYMRYSTSRAHAENWKTYGYNYRYERYWIAGNLSVFT